ncbi:YbaK/EbsC family protein [Candidatus Uhrbacteria bacterium]|nr:YbaK/EbsC family protein [Candidatus Uhrbacteria bacterium]
MAASKKILTHLKAGKVKFDVVEHKKVYTAYDLARTLGEKLEKIAKTLLVEAELPKLQKKGKNYFVVVLPASYRLDLQKLKKELKAKSAVLAPERVMKKFGIKPGELTPFGSLHKLEVLLDKGLAKTKEVILSAGSLTDAVRMKVKDLHKLEGARLVGAGAKIAAKKAKKRK